LTGQLGIAAAEATSLDQSRQQIEGLYQENSRLAQDKEKLQRILEQKEDETARLQAALSKAMRAQPGAAGERSDRLEATVAHLHRVREQVESERDRYRKLHGEAETRAGQLLVEVQLLRDRLQRYGIESPTGTIKRPALGNSAVTRQELERTQRDLRETREQISSTEIELQELVDFGLRDKDEDKKSGRS
jgi:chromosome segregation ATPase